MCSILYIVLHRERERDREGNGAGGPTLPFNRARRTHQTVKSYSEPRATSGQRPRPPTPTKSPASLPSFLPDTKMGSLPPFLQLGGNQIRSSERASWLAGHGNEQGRRGRRCASQETETLTGAWGHLFEPSLALPPSLPPAPAPAMGGRGSALTGGPPPYRRYIYRTGGPSSLSSPSAFDPIPPERASFRSIRRVGCGSPWLRCFALPGLGVAAQAAPRDARGGGVVHDVPAQVIGPLGHQWLHWQGGNANISRELTKEEIKEQRMFWRLETSPRVALEELLIYAVPEALTIQPEPIVHMLTEIVVIYNRMADTRRQYLLKRLDGVNGKQISLMRKKLQEDKEDAESRIEDVRSAGGFCPPLPPVFAELPELI